MSESLKHKELSKEEYALWVGKRVCKLTGRSFKSERKFNIARGLTTNPNSGRIAFTFEEDDSVVDCRTVRLAN